MDKFERGFELVYFGFVAVSAGYVAYKLMEEKTDDLAYRSDSMLNAFLMGAGHLAISTTVGLIAASTVMGAREQISK